MRNITSLTILVLFCIQSKGQISNKIWSNCFGGNNTDKAVSMVSTIDGGSISVGYSFSIDGDVNSRHDSAIFTQDIWVLKLSKTGTIIWSKSFGGSGYDEPSKIIETSDHGYLIVGFTSSLDGDINMLHYDSVADERDQYDCLLLKLDSIGNLEWSKCFGGYKLDAGISAVELKNGDFVIASISASKDGDVTMHHGTGLSLNEPVDFWIFRTNKNGQLIWQKSFGGSRIDYPSSISISNDSNLIITGFTSSIDGDINGNHNNDPNLIPEFDALVINIDMNGILKWAKVIGGTGDDRLMNVSISNKSEIVLVGYTNSYDGDLSGINVDSQFTYYYKGWFAKMNSSALITCSKTFLIPKVESSILSSISIDNTGYIICGEAWNPAPDGLIIQVDSTGEMIRYLTFGGDGEDYGVSILKNQDSNYTVLANTNTKNNGDIFGIHNPNPIPTVKAAFDYWVSKFDMYQVGIEYLGEIKNRISIYPNPSNDIITIKFGNEDSNYRIYNELGQLIFSGFLNQGDAKLNVNGWDSGLYLIGVEYEGGYFNQRIIVTH